MNQPTKYQNTKCCEAAKDLVFWHPKGRIRKLTGKPNPPHDGWTMSVDDEALVNVTFCPFCGVNLYKFMEVQDAKCSR